MTPYSGLLFFYVMGALLLPAILLGLWGKPLKYYGLVFTAAMLASVFWENGQLLQLILFYLWQTALCMVYQKLGKKTGVVFPLFLILVLLPLLAVKTGEVAAPLHFMRLLGVSYMTFRNAQVILDLHDGKLEKLSLFDYSYFLLFFPSVASGPIDRYQRFAKDLEQRPTREAYASLLRKGVWKLLWGALSAIVVSGLIQNLWLAPLPDGGFWATLSYMYGYTFFLFFNFAGYSSMAIGTAYILGVRLPENFNMPFLSVDMKDFWARWHISLSTWLRDYVYNRFVMGSLKAKRFKHPRTASYLGYILTMMTMGVWHGFAPQYLLYGAYHSGLMCLNEALDLHWKPFRKLKQKGWAQAVLVLVTFHLFSFGLLIFSGRLV